jgi:hypothetical protein
VSEVCIIKKQKRRREVEFLAENDIMTGPLLKKERYNHLILNIIIYIFFSTFILIFSYFYLFFTLQRSAGAHIRTTHIEKKGNYSAE